MSSTAMVAEGSHETAREAFELLFALLRRIDEDPDSIVFFADEAGAWQVHVHWEAVLPRYFQCLAEGDYQRPQHLLLLKFEKPKK